MDSQSELDNHADTCVVGDNALITHDFNRPVLFSGYDKSVACTKYFTVTDVLVYDDPLTGAVTLLVFHQAIHIPGLRHNLLCPMQMWMNGIQLSKNPKFLTALPTDHDHALLLPDHTGDFETVNTEDTENGDINRGPYLIPLSLHDVTSYFCTRKPTIDEAELPPNQYFELTYKSSEWDPDATEFTDKEAAFTNSTGLVRESGDRMESPATILFNSSASHTPVIPADYYGFLSALQANVHVSSVCFLPIMNVASVSTASGVRNTSRKSVDPESLAGKWDIGIEAAKRTVRSTTQRGLRTVLHPSLSCRFRTNDCQLRYQSLPVKLFADTLIANTKSRR